MKSINLLLFLLLLGAWSCSNEPVEGDEGVMEDATETPLASTEPVEPTPLESSRACDVLRRQVVADALGWPADQVRTAVSPAEANAVKCRHEYGEAYAELIVSTSGDAASKLNDLAETAGNTVVAGVGEQAVYVSAANQLHWHMGQGYYYVLSIKSPEGAAAGEAELSEIAKKGAY